MPRSIVRRLLDALLTAAVVAPSVFGGVGTASAVTDVQAVADGAPRGALVADAPARELRSIYPSEWGAPRPDGVAILPNGSSTLVVGDDQRLVKIAPTEELIGSLDLPAGIDVRDVGIDPVSGRFVIEDANELVWGRISSTSSTRSDTLDDLGLVTPAGLTFDAAGNLLTLDAATESIVNLGRPTTTLDATPTETPLPTGVGFATEGLAYNPADGLVYVTNVARDKLYGVDTQGVIHAAHDLSGIGILNLTGMSFGPSADATDDPETTSLYVADAGDATTLGRVAEISLAAEVALVAPSVTATLVRQTNTWQWNPASPDPAGVTYLSTKDRLIVVDSEVDETTGAGHRSTNLWETTRAGSVTTTGNTLGYTQEPTGAGFDPATATLFISTDARQRIHMVRPGGDNRYGTGDDLRTMIGTAQYGLGDTEDPAFDTAARHLFFVDGVDREVYRLDPGSGGVIGDGNDTVTHFDVGQYGAGDTEGLAYNPSTDTLYVGDRSNGTIYEVTKTGALVRTIDVNGISALNHVSGLGVGPSSDNASMTSIYIVDRAVDNGSNANENDGKLFEIRAPGGSPPPNTQPVVNAGPDQSITLPAQADLDGTVTDDGQPSGTLTIAWSKDSGPGTVTFGSPNAADTTASFSMDGTYVLRLTADDSTGPVSDTVTVTVNASGSTPGTLDVPIAAGSDDAEEESTGVMRLTRANLRLVNVSGTPQTVGLRFDDVALPPDANITNAYVAFRVHSTGSTTTNLSIGAQDHDDPPTFTTATSNISSRPMIGTSVPWSVPAWNTVGAIEQTSDLSPLIQAIVDRPGWAENNAMALIITGSGRRMAESFEAGSSLAPVLHVEFDVGPPTNAPPTVDAGTDQTVDQASSADLDGTVTDDGLPAPPGQTTTTWTKQSGPTTGIVTFGNPNAVDTTASFSQPGTYVLRLTADDSTGPVFDEVTIRVLTAGNTAPSVDAGTDQTITLPDDTAALDATVTDDGVPTAATLQWTEQSGPGTVTFTDATAADTTATFSEDGTYVLRLTADDTEAQDSDEVTITVEPEPVTGGTLDVPIAADSDDAEEESGGVMRLTRVNLRLVNVSGTPQTVGLRFTGVAIPNGADITNAYVQFTADRATSMATSLVIQGEATDDAPTFTTAANSISSRARTTASASWSPSPWTAAGSAGAAEQTSNIAAVIEEIVARGGWVSNNDLVLIITGNGRRVAESFESGAPPVLHIEYQTP